MATAFVNGFVQCPQCDAARFSSARGLMAHFTAKHTGEAISSDGIRVLQLLDRAVCTVPQCGGINRVGSRRCNRCFKSAPLRALQDGDIIPGVLTSGEPVSSQTAPARELASSSNAPAQTQPATVQLPADWTERVRALPATSKLHVPVQFRARHAAAWNECLEGMAAKDATWCKLEEARTKLLLNHCPEGVSTAKELGERFAMWSQRKFEDLLSRAERQHLMRPTKTRKKRVDDDSDHGRRANLMTQEGAYSKAIGALATDAVSFSPEDERRHATELLPCSSRSDAHSLLDPGRQRPRPDDDTQASSTSMRDPDWEHPLARVRFAPMIAPGPTGARAEHAQEAFSIRQQAIPRRLARSMRKVQLLAMSGDLPEEARWLTRTRLVLLKKKGSHKPRPVRIGEFLKSAVAKKVQKKAAPHLRTVFRSMHQWGVQMPGGTEALIHWRGAIEELAMSGAIEPVVALDLDLANMFCNIEWPEIRAAISKHFVEAAEWYEWDHQANEDVVLPCGDLHSINRGAGQGDVFGSSSSSLALGERIQEHRQRHQEAVRQQINSETSLAVDEWYVDDGQAIVALRVADIWLRSVDMAIAAVGGHRASGSTCKSYARLLCTPEFAASNPEWASDYIKSTCVVQACAEAPKVLGVHVGGLAIVDRDMTEIT